MFIQVMPYYLFMLDFNMKARIQKSTSEDKKSQRGSKFCQLIPIKLNN